MLTLIQIFQSHLHGKKVFFKSGFNKKDPRRHDQAYKLEIPEDLKSTN